MLIVGNAGMTPRLDKSTYCEERRGHGNNGHVFDINVYVDTHYIKLSLDEEMKSKQRTRE